MPEAGEGNGSPLQSSCLEHPMDGGAWWAAVHGVARSQPRLSDFTLTFHFPALEKEMATRSSVLAWRIPGTGEPGGLPSMGSHSRTRLKWLSSGSCSMPEAGEEKESLHLKGHLSSFPPNVSTSEHPCPSHCDWGSVLTVGEHSNSHGSGTGTPVEASAMTRRFIPGREMALALSLGLGVLLLNINMNTFSEHQRPTRPLCDHNVWRQEQESLIISKHRQNMNIVQTTVDTRPFWPVRASLPTRALVSLWSALLWIRFTKIHICRMNSGVLSAPALSLQKNKSFNNIF